MQNPGKISYRDVKASVLQRIRNKTWQPGEIVPGELALAAEFGCARATVNRAMRELAEEGIIDRKRKAGTRVKKSPTREAKFVIPLIRLEIENTGVAYRYALIRRETLLTPDWLRARLGLAEQSEVLHLHCMHYAGNRPFQFEDRWINLDAVPNAKSADFSEIGPNEWLVNEVPFTEIELTFSASSATAKLAEIFEIDKGSALFSAERTTWLNGRSVTYAKLNFAPGYQMTTRL